MAEKNKKTSSYFFPISLLQEFSQNPYNAMQDICDYLICVVAEEARKNGYREPDAIDVACRFLGMRTYSKDLASKKAKIKGRVGKETKSPFTHIKSSLFWEYMDRYDPNTNNTEIPQGSIETASLLCYLGLVSIAGKIIDKEIKTTQNLIFARMSGHKVCNDPEIDIDIELEKYTSRKQFENLKKAVEDAFNIEFKRGHQRGVNFKVKPHKK